MYKVFIDKCIIHFKEISVISNFNSDTLYLSKDDIVDLTHEDILKLTQAYTKIIVQVPDLESGVRTFFNSYQFRETAGGIVQRKKKFLFIKRNGLWDLPKGHVESVEIVEETAIREIEEECGIQGPEIVRFLGITFHTYEFKGKPVLKKNSWFLLSYSGSKSTNPQIEEGITEVKWLKKSKFKKVLKKTYPSIQDVIHLFLNQ